MNVERAMRLSDRLGGHFVTGHIDCVGSVESISPESLSVSLPKEFMGNVVEKGSIAIDGISLTATAVSQNTVSVALIPHTFEHTNLHTRKAGSRVNVETDIIAKHVKRLLQLERSGGITMGKLERHGFQ